MNIYTVSFFGHRHLSDQFAIEGRLDPILRDLINSKEYVEFLVGRDGDFDQLVSSAIIRAKEKYAYGNVSHILVLPYERADYRDNKESFGQYYDEVQICAESSGVHYKAAILERNKSMVRASGQNIVVFALLLCGIVYDDGKSVYSFAGYSEGAAGGIRYQ